MQPFIPAVLTLILPALAFAAPQSFSELVAEIVLVINVATPVLVALALALFLVRVIGTAVGPGGDKEKGFASARFRKMAPWGIGIIFVMVSIWGILRLVENTFLGRDTGAVDNQTDKFCEGLENC